MSEKYLQIGVPMTSLPRPATSGHYSRIGLFHSKTAKSLIRIEVVRLARIGNFLCLTWDSDLKGDQKLKENIQPLMYLPHQTRRWQF